MIASQKQELISLHTRWDFIWVRFTSKSCSFRSSKARPQVAVCLRALNPSLLKDFPTSCWATVMKDVSGSFQRRWAHYYLPLDVGGLCFWMLSSTNVQPCGKFWLGYNFNLARSVRTEQHANKQQPVREEEEEEANSGLSSRSTDSSCG